MSCDFYDAPALYNSRIVRVRKPHKCVECRAVIQPGQQAEKIDALYSEGFSTFYTCLDCVELIAYLRTQKIELCCHGELGEIIYEEDLIFSDDELEEIYSAESWYDDSKGCVRGQSCPIVTKAPWLKIVNGHFRLEKLILEA